MAAIADSESHRLRLVARQQLNRIEVLVAVIEGQDDGGFFDTAGLEHLHRVPEIDDPVVPLQELHVSEEEVSGDPQAMRPVGHDVVGYDPDLRRVKQLNAGESYIEDVSHEEIAAIASAGLFRASTDAADLADFDTAVIAVPTPLHEGAPDLAYIEAAAKSLARHLRRGATVVLESTTYPGTTADLVGPILENGSGLAAEAVKERRASSAETPLRRKLRVCFEIIVSPVH